jgi:hypothetical protein
MASKGTCKASDCERAVIAKGYCRKHYRLWKRGAMPKPRYKTCTFENCRRRRSRGSLCQEHSTARVSAGSAGAPPSGGAPPASGGEPATPAG